MNHFNPFSLQEFRDWDKVSVRRNQYSAIEPIGPCKTDDIGRDSGIYALFLGAPHIAFAGRADSSFRLARWALWVSLFALPLLKDYAYASHFIQRIDKPILEF